jgi:hypothetical protein
MSGAGPAGLRVERVGDGGAGLLLVLDRPAARNAIDDSLLAALLEAVDGVAAAVDGGVHDAPRYLVVGGAGGTFSAGMDLKERAAFDDARLRAQRAGIVGLMTRVHALAVPAIAAVEGACLAGGFELALACDLVVASESAVFGLPEVGVGIFPGGGSTHTLPRLVGPARARDIVLTGRRLSAAEAEAGDRRPCRAARGRPGGGRRPRRDDRPRRAPRDPRGPRIDPRGPCDAGGGDGGRRSPLRPRPRLGRQAGGVPGVRGEAAAAIHRSLMRFAGPLVVAGNRDRPGGVEHASTPQEAIPMRRVPALATILAVAAVLAIAVAPAAAKEGMTATLDAPIPMGEPGGTELLVGVRVEIMGETGSTPVYGSPIYIQLTGRGGDIVREYLTEERDVRGHYLGRIAVPAGGARAVEVGMGGSTDFVAMLTADPLTFGPVSARTAQVAPPKVAITPWPRTSAAPAGAAPAGGAGAAPSSEWAGAGSQAAAPAGPASDASAPAAPSAIPAWAIGLTVLGVGGVVAAAVILRLARGARDLRGPGADAAGRGADR